MAPYVLPSEAVWLITGCSSGIGQALCAHLATSTSSRIVATARNPASLSTLPDGPNVLKLALDVTSETSMQDAIAAALERFGRIDVVVNNAGFGTMGDTETIPLERAHTIMDANFWGAVRMTQLSLPIFRERNAKSGQRGGLLVQVTSMGGRVAFAGNAFYHASKFALEGFSEALSRELPEHWGIHVLCVEPGGVKTRYAETATGGFDAQGRLAAYTDPALPTNVLLRYKESPAATANWAEPDKVARALYKFVEDGGELPLRLPLGSDSWGMQKRAHEEELKELEKVKSISLSTSGAEQLKSLDFLRD